MTIANEELSLVERAATVQVHFTLGGEGLKAQRKSSWMKSLHGVLHGRLWIRFHGLPELASGPPPRGRPNANSGRPWQSASRLARLF